MITQAPPVFRSRPGQIANGYPVGMLCAEWNVPFVPGDLNHAATFRFPMRYHKVEGLIGADILRGDAEKYTDLVVTAAQRLEAEGVRAITANCGFMAVFQGAVASAVGVPVFLSSLLQLNMLSVMVGADRKIGVVTANSEAMTPALLNSVGFIETDRIAVQGLESFEHFNEVILQEIGEMNLHRFAAEVVKGTKQLQRRVPTLGAILLECSDLPAYSKAIREATGLPVFDWASFIDYVQRALEPRAYLGAY